MSGASLFDFQRECPKNTELYPVRCTININHKENSFVKTC